MSKKRNKYSYYVDGNEVELKIDEKSLAICFAQNIDFQTKREVLNSHGTGDNFSFRKKSISEGFDIVSTPTSVIREAYGSYDVFFEAFNSKVEINVVRPVFNIGSTKAFVSNKCIIKLKGGRNKKIADKIIKDFNFLTYYEDDTEGNSYVFQCNPDEEIFDYIEKTQNDSRIEYVDPVFFINFSNQIKLNGITPASNSLSTPIDALNLINAVEARNLVSNLNQIKIAILDSGIDEIHPNLSPSIVDVFDAITNSNTQSTITEKHGTAVASLMAGININGLKGVADGAKIFSAKIIGDDEFHEQRTINRALNWVESRNIDIINLSVSFLNTNAIRRQITRLIEDGRGGKGTIIIAAAGNNTNDVLFPASLDNIITVSSCDSMFFPINDRIKYNWFAPNGSKIDIVAPGINVFAADISGTRGDFPGDYLLNGFSGTSCSAPLVTGLVALLLAKNQNLTLDEVRTIIISSANKVTTVPYDTNGHNLYLGFGVINCLGAINQLINA